LDVKNLKFDKILRSFSDIINFFSSFLQLCEVSAVGDPEPGTFAATGEAEQRKQGAEPPSGNISNY
jgi:hypothetical protein